MTRATSPNDAPLSPPRDLTGLVQRFWIPVWSVEPGREAPQRVLQYPCALVVVAHDYARFYASGVRVVDDDPGRRRLGGRGDVRAGRGFLIAGRSMAERST